MAKSTSHSNNFGLLRLTFAVCVIVSHSFEIIDGDRSREPLTRLFGTVSLGDLGVSGFFVASGYLITQSFETTPTVLSYIWKRILRIYPGFIAASLVCLMVVAPFSGADMADLLGIGAVKSLIRIVLLARPSLPGAFSEQPIPALNGSMWTIAYEFRCYVLLAILGLLGVLRRRKTFLAIGVATLLLSAFSSIDFNPPSVLHDLLGTLRSSTRFDSLFFSGALFYLYRDKVHFSNVGAAVALPTLTVSLLSAQVASLAIPVLGGYLIFWFSFLSNTERLNSINRSTDISYGVYLYAWPVQMLLVRFIDGISPLSVFLISTFFSVVLAYLSWCLIEKPFLSLKGASFVAVSSNRENKFS